MNKMAKLPIFLGVVGCVCSGILGAVYSITQPIIDKNALEKANAAYISMYADYGVVATDIEQSEDYSDITGCTGKAIIVNQNVKGITYTCAAKGYGGSFTFQIAFANGKYLSYTDLGNSETGAYGAGLIAQMPTLVNGIDANTALLDDATYSDAQSGRSVTGKALAKQIENCRVDYMTWYSAQIG